MQVQQVKKVAKFSCRLCGTRQSVKHVRSSHACYDHCCRSYSLYMGMTKPFRTHATRECEAMRSMQVHAMSSKASDVRAMVMDLNAKRQAAEERGDAMDPSSPPTMADNHVKRQAVSAVAWQHYNEVCTLPLHAGALQLIRPSSMSATVRI